MTMRLPFLSIAAVVFTWLGATPADAQVVVYRFDFEKDGPAINYGFYDEAYVIADAVGGPATWVFTFKEGIADRYVTANDFGSLYYANNQKLTYAVISAAASTGTPQTTFLAMGEVEDGEVKTSQVSVKVARSMTGSTLSADDQSSLPFDSTEGNVGFAAISTMTGGLQEQRTTDANEAGLSAEETLTELLAYLGRRGFTEFVAEVDDTDTGEDDTDTDADTADTDTEN